MTVLFVAAKIHKRLFDVPGRPAISNCGYYTENISAFIDHHIKSFSKCVKSYIKDTNNFLQKLRELPKLPNDTILCTIDVVGLYPNRREEKTPSTESLAELGNVC